MRIKYKEIETIGEFIDAIRIRVGVFIVEQKFKPGWEPDNEDKISKQYIAVIDRVVVGTARLREILKGEQKIERMAIKKGYRNKGIGKGLVNYIILHESDQKPKIIWTQAQTRAQKFYEKCGFKTIFKPYNLYDIEHVDMEFPLN